MKKFTILILLVTCTIGYSQINLKKLSKGAESKVKEERVSNNDPEKYLVKINQVLDKIKSSEENGTLSSKNGMVNNYLSDAQRKIEEFKEKFPSVSIALQEQRLKDFNTKRAALLEKDPSGSNRRNLTTDLASVDDSDNVTYFRSLNSLLSNNYSEPSGMEGWGPNMKDLWEQYKNFNRDEVNKRIVKAKLKPDYLKYKGYVEKCEAILADYSAYIQRSQPGFHDHLDDVNEHGVKGDPIKEKIELEEAQLFCKILLQIEPNNPTAVSWLQQVEKQIGKTCSSITYASELHKKYLGKIMFSNKEVAIGNESDNDFTAAFKSGDYIYATVYLPAKLRQLTDSYASNNMMIKINGRAVAEASYTVIWVTTPMQEKNYLQFAILPSDSWKQKNGQPYIENNIRTHEAIAERLVEAGPYSDINVDVKVIFRGTNSSIEGSFKIDQSSGVEQLKAIVAREENSRLNEVKLPKAGMSNADLQNQALTIMRNKSEGSGKTYSKAIITSVNWDYDKTYTGVTISRSLVIALVSKEHDGKCMYQYFNFKQQAKGNGAFNSNLEFAGAGDNVYMSCQNID